MKDIIMIWGLLLCSCSVFKSSDIDTGIRGRWCSKLSTADYPHLTFQQDGYLIFDCKIDTFFALKYTLNKNQLLIIRADKSTNKNNILKLTQDSLILETLLENKTKQIYYRCK